MAVTYSRTDSSSRWIDVRNLPAFMGQQFTASHSENKDLTLVKLACNMLGSAQNDASLSSSIDVPVPLPSILTYYGTNNYGSAKANFLSGNSGTYADYQVSCAIANGKYLSIVFDVDGSAISGGGDVQFDVVVTNVGESQVLTFTVHSYQATPNASIVLRMKATEAWSTYKIEFNNFSWNGTGTVSITEISMRVLTTIKTWDVDNDSKLTVRLYDNVNEFMVATCAETGLKSFLPNQETEVSILKKEQNYSLAASRDYRLVVGMKDVSLLSNQLIDLIVPVLPDVADPQIQIVGTEPENIIPGMPWDVSATFELNPDRADSVFAGQARINHTDLLAATPLVLPAEVGVVAGNTYSFLARVRIPQTGIAATYTIRAVSANDGAVIAFRSQAIVDQAPDYFFEEDLTVVIPADVSAIRCEIVTTATLPTVYVDGVILTLDSEGSPGRYYFSQHVSSPVSVAIKTASTEADPVDSWVAGSWTDISQNSVLTSIEVSDVVSSLPSSPLSLAADLENSVIWPVDFSDQPPVMADLINRLQAIGNQWISDMRPIIQINKPAAPVLADWISAYRKAGGLGDLPINGSFRWSDSSQSDHEWTAEYTLLPLSEVLAQDKPIQENGIALLGSTTRVPFSFAYVEKVPVGVPTYPEEFTGVQIDFDLLRAGQSELNMMCSMGARESSRTSSLSSSDVAHFNLLVDSVPLETHTPGPTEGQVMSHQIRETTEIPTYLMAISRGFTMYPGLLAAGDRNIFVRFFIISDYDPAPPSTDSVDGKVGEFSIISATGGETDGDLVEGQLPLAQVEVYHV